MSKIEEVKAKLEAAIEAAKKAGFRVEPGEWGVDIAVNVDFVEDARVWKAYGGGDCLCPMACVIVDKPMAQPSRTSWPEEAAAKELGITQEEVENFIRGFDSDPIVPEINQDEFYRLGLSFRSRYLTGGL